MTYEEYATRFRELYNAIEDLKEEFVKDNPFNQFVGKKVIINDGEIVIFEGVRFGHMCRFPELHIRKIKKDGTPYASDSFKYCVRQTTIKLAE